MRGFERLIGAWHGTGRYPDPPMELSADITIDRLGELLVFRSDAQPAELPSSVSIIGGAPEGEPQPMAYFDSRGVRRPYLTSVEGSTWRIWFAPDYDWRGPDGPGFDQRFIGDLSADGGTIDARWERRAAQAGAAWQLDFPMTYIRMSAGNVFLFGGIPVRDFAAALPWYRQLFGGDPTFVATETEAGWVLATDRSVYIEQVPERAGGAMNTILVPDLDAEVARISARGLEPWKRETYDNGVRKVTYRDPDGNEFGLGELPT